MGRTDGNHVVIFAKTALPFGEPQKSTTTSEKTEARLGEYVAVEIKETGPATLKGDPLYRTTLRDFHARSQS